MISMASKAARSICAATGSIRSVRMFDAHKLNCPSRRVVSTKRISFIPWPQVVWQFSPYQKKSLCPSSGDRFGSHGTMKGPRDKKKFAPVGRLDCRTPLCRLLRTQRGEDAGFHSFPVGFAELERR